MRRARVEVVKLGFDPEVKPDWVKAPCPDQKVGQVFYTSGKHGDACPDGMCYLAWQSLAPIIQTLVRGGKMFERYDSYVGCCPNGGRPVVFDIKVVDVPDGVDLRALSAEESSLATFAGSVRNAAGRA